MNEFFTNLTTDDAPEKIQRTREYHILMLQSARGLSKAQREAVEWEIGQITDRIAHPEPHRVDKELAEIETNEWYNKEMQL